MAAPATWRRCATWSPCRPAAAIPWHRGNWKSASARPAGAAGRWSSAITISPRRRRRATLQRHYDIAHAAQVVLEEAVGALTGWLHEAAGLDSTTCAAWAIS